MIDDKILHQDGVKLFTIGFSGKSAEQFFKIIQKAKVKKVIDIRLIIVSQLAGFTKRDNLKFFLSAIAGIKYEHRHEMAPTQQLLDDYKKKIVDWLTYENKFKKIMIDRAIEDIMKPNDLDHACLLCSEQKADQCHRRLVAEYLKMKWKKVYIQHL